RRGVGGLLSSRGNHRQDAKYHHACRLRHSPCRWHPACDSRHANTRAASQDRRSVDQGRRLSVNRCRLRADLWLFRLLLLGDEDRSAMNLRDYTFLGTTHSLCPECRRLLEAKTIVRQGRVYFRKQCPEHGAIEDFVCSDVAYYDRNEFSQPARLPRAYGTNPDKGCPYDCGLCTEHEQHTCIELVEITSSCNLRCPMCFAESGRGGKPIDFATYTRMVDRFVYLEGIPDVLQISGGEPTIHPDLMRMVRYVYEQPIQAVMINTNGIRLAHDEDL